MPTMWPSIHYKEWFSRHKRAVHEEVKCEILQSIKGLCMKESNTLADNVAIRQLQREVLLSIKGLCMKESNTLADNVAFS